MTGPAGPPATGDLARRLDGLAAAAPRATAVAAAAVDGSGREAVAGPAHAVFEAGSVSKTFTALLLAAAADRGEASAHDPAVRYLPAGVRPRGPGAAAVRLLHLATHTSGLPRLPPNLYPVAAPHWWTTPYADYTEEHLLRATARARPAPGRRVRYSNFGVGLLGYLLTRAAGQSHPEGYPALLAERISNPLGLARTTAVPTAPATAKPPPGLVTGSRRGRPVPPMTRHGLTAAGGVHTTAADLLRYLRCHLDPGAAPPPLARALRETLRPRLARRGGDRLALVWNIRDVAGRETYFHCGATRGHTVFAGFCPEAGVALAALAATTASPGDRFVPAAYLLLRELVSEAA